MRRRLFETLTALCACAVLAGCGGGAKSARGPINGVGTIQSWSEALTRGDLAAASALFAIPSLAQIDPAGAVARIAKAADARALDESLPCGAKLLDARSRGGYLDALFLLTQRPGVNCNGTGNTARVAFRISAGKIVEWRRIADEPGDSSRGTAPQPPQQTVPGQPAPNAPNGAPSPQERSV